MPPRKRVSRKAADEAHKARVTVALREIDPEDDWHDVVFSPAPKLTEVMVYLHKSLARNFLRRLRSKIG